MPSIQVQLVMCVDVTWGLPSIHLYLLFRKKFSVLKNEKQARKGRLGGLGIKDPFVLGGAC